MPPRSLWNGALSIAGVTIPVKVFAATERHNPRFRELHVKDGAPIEHRRVSAKSGREVPFERIVKGYETSNGRYVVLTDDEIKAMEAPKRKAIDLEDFVPLDQIDPVFFDRAYHVGAADEGRDAFAAFLHALTKTETAGIGRVTLRTREQLVAVRAGDEVLRMSTMRYADELTKAPTVDAPKKPPTKREQEMAAKLVDGMVETFDPKRFSDSYRKRVEDYAKAKAKGKEPELPEVEEREETDDLLAALKASMKDA